MNPGNVVSITRTPGKHRLSQMGADLDENITLDSTIRDTNESPTTKIGAGNVVLKATGTGRYHEANDTANGTVNAAATITSSEDVDADWASIVHTFEVNEEKFTVSAASTDTTAALQVALLNANATYALHLTATVSGSKVVHTTKNKGADIRLKITADLSTAYGANGQEALGVDGVYRVTEYPVMVADVNGTAINADVKAARRGHFDESVLVNLTTEAKAVLLRNGCIFD